jgi:hypothetical protein
MRAAVKKIAAIGAVIGLVASSTAAVAAAPAPVAHTGYQAPNAWVMLTALSPSAAGVLGSAAVAAQPADAPPADVPPPPPPGPPPPVAATGGVAFGELLPIALWFGLIAVAFAATDNGASDTAIGSPNSPA